MPERKAAKADGEWGWSIKPDLLYKKARETDRQREIRLTDGRTDWWVNEVKGGQTKARTGNWMDKLRDGGEADGWMNWDTDKWTGGVGRTDKRTNGRKNGEEMDGRKDGGRTNWLMIDESRVPRVDRPHSVLEFESHFDVRFYGFVSLKKENKRWWKKGKKWKGMDKT